MLLFKDVKALTELLYNISSEIAFFYIYISWGFITSSQCQGAGMYVLRPKTIKKTEFENCIDINNYIV